MAMATSEQLAEFLHRIDTRVFHVPPLAVGDSALERLLALVIQEDDGSYAVAEKAVRALRGGFVHWSEIRVARQFEVQDCLTAARIGDADHRADLIQSYLRRIFGLQNHLDLDWLYDATSERREKLLDALAIAPEHARFVLDLDAIDEDDEDDPGTPVTPALKRLFSRMGWVSNNPKESVVRELLEPLVEGDKLYPNYSALAMLARALPQSKPSRCMRTEALKAIFANRTKMSDAQLTETLAVLPYPYVLINTGYGPKKKATKKATKKKVVKKAKVSKKKA
jgi:endonuclease III